MHAPKSMKMARTDSQKTVSTSANNPGIGKDWQAHKSQLTKQKILEATLTCLIDLGYARTTAWKISSTAGISRGAMTHHFASQKDVIIAAAGYLQDKRIEEFRALVSEIAHPGTMELSREDFRKAIEAVAHFLQLPSYTAFHELVLAARTDPQLAMTIDPIVAGTEQRISQVILAAFPVWEDDPSTMQLLSDLIFFCLQGIAATPYAKLMTDGRLAALYEFLADEAMHSYERSRQTAASSGSAA